MSQRRVWHNGKKQWEKIIDVTQWACQRRGIKHVTTGGKACHKGGHVTKGGKACHESVYVMKGGKACHDRVYVKHVRKEGMSQRGVKRVMKG